MSWYDITGTVADWVMAGAAGYAAYLAKNWIKPNLQQQGLLIFYSKIFQTWQH
ncbi:hypothetical protein ACWKYD_04720 [Enterobacter cloacae]